MIKIRVWSRLDVNALFYSNVNNAHPDNVISDMYETIN